MIDGCILYLSNRHVSQETRDWLDVNAMKPPAFQILKVWDGWHISTAGLDECEGIPADLLAVATYAECNGASLIVLDEDAPAVDALPVFVRGLEGDRCD